MCRHHIFVICIWNICNFWKHLSIQYNSCIFFHCFFDISFGVWGGIRLLFKVGQQHFIGFDSCHQSYSSEWLLSILFIGIYSNQILVHDPAVNETKWYYCQKVFIVIIVINTNSILIVVPITNINIIISKPVIWMRTSASYNLFLHPQ